MVGLDPCRGSFAEWTCGYPNRHSPQKQIARQPLPVCEPLTGVLHCSGLSTVVQDIALPIQLFVSFAFAIM